MNDAQNTMAIIRTLAQQNKVSINKTLLDSGLGKSLVVDSERNNQLPTADKLAKIADYFNVSVDYLLGRTDKPEVNK